MKIYWKYFVFYFQIDGFPTLFDGMILWVYPGYLGFLQSRDWWFQMKRRSNQDSRAEMSNMLGKYIIIYCLMKWKDFHKSRKNNRILSCRSNNKPFILSICTFWGQISCQGMRISTINICSINSSHIRSDPFFPKSKI